MSATSGFDATERSQYKAYAIRPYHDSIRKKVFEVLRRASIEVVPTWVAPKGATDDQVIAQLATIVPDVLLAPFHAGKDDLGGLVNGMQTVQRLMEHYSFWMTALPLIRRARRHQRRR